MRYLENGRCKSHAVFAGSSLALIVDMLHQCDAANVSCACRRLSYPMVLPSLENGASAPTMNLPDFFLDQGAAIQIPGICSNLTPFDVAVSVLLCRRRFRVCPCVFYPILPLSRHPHFRLLLAGACARAGSGTLHPATVVARCPHVIPLLLHHFIWHPTAN